MVVYTGYAPVFCTLTTMGSLYIALRCRSRWMMGMYRLCLVWNAICSTIALCALGFSTRERELAFCEPVCATDIACNSRELMQVCFDCGAFDEHGDGSDVISPCVCHTSEFRCFGDVNSAQVQREVPGASSPQGVRDELCSSPVATFGYILMWLHLVLVGAEIWAHW